MSKIFIVVNVDWFFLSHRKEIALSAQKNGYETVIVTRDTGKKKEIEALGLEVIDLPMDRSVKSIFQEIKTFFFLYRLYCIRKPDVVHHVGLKTILWGTLAAKFAGINGVVNAVSGLGTLFSEETKSFFTRALLPVMRFSHQRKNMIVIFQNNEDRELFIGNRIITPSQAWYIKGSGVNLTDFHYEDEPGTGKINIIFTGRMILEKGIKVLVDAAEKIKEEYKDKVRFLLCGGLDDNPKAITRTELETMCDGEYIQWLGYRTDIRDLLITSHIVAFPSYYKEGLPKSLIEATAVGRPIITTNSIGCKETVKEGYNGFLIPVKDSETLAERLKNLIDDPALRKEMGKNSRVLAEKEFSVTTVINEHLAIYKQLAKGR